MPMIDDWLLSLIYAAWLAASTMPLGFMLGAPCSPCCDQGCGVADGKPRTDPVNEGTWVPSGTWSGAGGVTWSFTANPGDESGETWFFYGSASTSKVGGGASTTEQRDWGNICNWYSSKTTTPSSGTGLPGAFDKRATRFPPETAVVHVYTPISTDAVGPQIVKNIYFWNGGGDLLSGSELTSTASAHDSTAGVVFGGAANAENFGIINNGATFHGQGRNGAGGVVHGGAVFRNSSQNRSTVNDGATFNDGSGNDATVNGGATFNDGSGNSQFGEVNDGAVLNDNSLNSGAVSGGAIFNGNSQNNGTVNDGATFNDDSTNVRVVNNGATFNDNSANTSSFVSTGTVNGGATFNDAACSTRTTGFLGTPCTRKFVAHPTDLPTCNGTAPDGCFTPAASCGCG